MRAKEAHTAGAYPGFRSMKQLRVLLLPPPPGLPPVPIYTPGWGGIMWSKVSCLRKQHDGRDWASNHRTSELKSDAVTTTPPWLHQKCFEREDKVFFFYTENRCFLCFIVL